MKAKFIRDLDEKELKLFHNSHLFSLMSSHWNYTGSYINYNKEYFGLNYIEYSIVVFENDIFYIGLWSFSCNEVMSFFNQPIHIFHFNEYSKQFNLAYVLFINKLSELKKNNIISKLICFQNPYILSFYFNNIINTEISYDSYINLLQPVEIIKMNVRKSYKSLINWGASNLQTLMINNDNCDKTIFNSFKDFHIKVSGRQTRSDYSWDLQFNAIRSNNAFLLLGYMGNKMVSGSYIIYSSENAYYGVAVNDRDLMGHNVPVGHYLLFSSILSAKNLGIKTFKLGGINRNTDDKISNINNYKKGFSNTINTLVKLTIEL